MKKTYRLPNEGDMLESGDDKALTKIALSAITCSMGDQATSIEKELLFQKESIA